jgi:hypothetical protein
MLFLGQTVDYCIDNPHIYHYFFDVRIIYERRTKWAN